MTPEPVTPEQEADVRRDHRQGMMGSPQGIVPNGSCLYCGHRWPCLPIRALDSLTASRAENERLRAEAKDAQDDIVEVIHGALPEFGMPSDSYSAGRMAEAMLVNLRTRLSETAAERDTLKAELADARTDANAFRSEWSHAVQEQEVIRLRTIEDSLVGVEKLSTERDTLKAELAEARAAVEELRGEEELAVSLWKAEIKQLSGTAEKLVSTLSRSEAERDSAMKALREVFRSVRTQDIPDTVYALIRAALAPPSGAESGEGER